MCVLSSLLKPQKSQGYTLGRALRILREINAGARSLIFKESGASLCIPINFCRMKSQGYAVNDDVCSFKSLKASEKSGLHPGQSFTNFTRDKCGGPFFDL